MDLYVLERAFASTHPASEGMYAGVLEAYGKGLGEKKWGPIEAKLKEGECGEAGSQCAGHGVENGGSVCHWPWSQPHARWGLCEQGCPFDLGQDRELVLP